MICCRTASLCAAVRGVHFFALSTVAAAAAAAGCTLFSPSLSFSFSNSESLDSAADCTLLSSLCWTKRPRDCKKSSHFAMFCTT